MEKASLGLPLEYQQLPEYFDAQNVNEETEAKNAVIESCLKRNHVNTVLDITCGTGSQVFYLTERGYKVTGSDFSPPLIEIAKQRAKEKQLAIPFMDGDMRTIQAGTFDAVISIFNAVGHLTKEDFGVTLENIKQNLKEGGIFVFDIFNLEALTDDMMPDMAMEIVKEIDGCSLRHKQHSTLDSDQGLLTSYDYYWIQKPGEEPKEYTNSFSLQIYSSVEIRALLEEHGFKVLEQIGMDGEVFDPAVTQNMLTVASVG